MSVPRKSDRSGTRGYAHLVEVEAPVARVWRALTDPALIRIWSAARRKSIPRKGGLYRLGNGVPAAARRTSTYSTSTAGCG